jgi:6-phosphogluconate dehydrogenase (decarboxylating)
VAVATAKEVTTQIAMTGLGRMGAHMVRRLVRQGHNCVVFNRSAHKVNELVKEKAIGAASLADVARWEDGSRPDSGVPLRGSRSAN